MIPTPEDAPFPVQTSLYGASKLAGEGLISGLLRRIRLPGVHLPLRLDSRRALHPRPRLRFLQAAFERIRRVCACSATASSASRTSTCRTASTRCCWRSSGRRTRSNIFNLGTDEYCQVNDSIGWITEQLGVSPTLEYTGGDRGWIGDNPFIFLDTARIRALGWTPTLSIREGILRTLDYLQANPGCSRRAREGRVLGLWHLGSVTAACLASAGTCRDGLRSGSAHRRRPAQAASRRSPSRACRI